MHKSLSAMIAILSFTAFQPDLAFAGEQEAAEHQRYLEEMRKLSGRNAWTGVERNFKLLLKLQDDGEVLTAEDWLLGAQAARNLGNMTSCRERLAASVRIKPEREAVGLLEEIDRSYGVVELSSDKGLEAALAPAAMPFIPDQRKAIEYAQAQVAENGAFEGILEAPKTES